MQVFNLLILPASLKGFVNSRTELLVELPDFTRSSAVSSRNFSRKAWQGPKFAARCGSHAAKFYIAVCVLLRAAMKSCSVRNSFSRAVRSGLRNCVSSNFFPSHEAEKKSFLMQWLLYLREKGLPQSWKDIFHTRTTAVREFLNYRSSQQKQSLYIKVSNVSTTSVHIGLYWIVWRTSNIPR